jgi:bacillithiol biosynthesis cysteine-adding enzyme BshC
MGVFYLYPINYCYMEIGCLPFNKTGVFSSLMEDYVSQAAGLRSFYGNSPDVAGLNAQRTLKKAVYTQAQRTVLQDVLREQYRDLKAVDVVERQIELLGDPKTTTVVTGHQLNLFSGPLYFLYKIISVINLAEALSDQKTLGAVVPVYWMATEDHDFEEINFFKVNGVKLQWTPKYKISGPVGRYATKGLEAILPALEALLGTHKNAQYLVELFEDAYVKQPTLAKATRYFAHTLFGDKGLVVIDGDHPALKKMLIPHIEKDLFEQLAFKHVSQTAQSLLDKNYHVQVNPRPINYFYMEDGLRERIVAVEGGFEVLNTKKFFTPLEMKAHIASNPENFSPNVIARPLYQELILPNIAYTGGGGGIGLLARAQGLF